MSEFTFTIRGPEDEKIARELAAFFRDEFALDVVPRRPVSTPGEVTRADPVAVAALVVAIPGALLASADLVGRMALGKKLDRLRAWVTRRRQSHPETALSVRLPSGAVHRLENVEKDVMLEEAAMAARGRR